MFALKKQEKFEFKDAGSEDEAEKIKKEIKSALDSVKTELKEDAKKALDEVKKSGGLSQETKTKVDQLLTSEAELKARLEELEQKYARRTADNDNAPKSIGEKFIESDEFKKFQGEKGKRKMHLEFKAVTNITSATTGTGAAGDLVRPDRLNVMVATPDRRMTVRDLITPGRTNSNLVEYVKETGFQNSAAVVAEGAAKPQTDIAFDLVTTPVVTIAHWVKASNQIIADAPMLASYIDGRLTYGLQYVEEQQLLNGSGSGGNINGIYTQATAYSEPAGGNPTGNTPTPIDIIRLALLQAELAEYPATGIVLNPTQWCAIELQKDDNGRYIIGNPQAEGQARLWGRPVVTTQAMANDKFLVGAFKLGAQVFDREEANVQISTEDGDNFIKNMVTIRAEERLALAVYRPEAFIKGDLGLVT